MNRQGSDVGTQYSSAIFYGTPEQKAKAEALVKELTDSKSYDKPIVTALRPLETFYEAESYHRDYYKNHSDTPYCELVIAPKLEKLQKKFAELIK
jgi:peptide-methionine (S)-S-oxide reductase